jgi:hypothetical protein
MNLVTLCNKACYSLPKERESLMRDSRYSFIKIGTARIPEDLSCGQASVCAYRLYESKEGYTLQHDSRGL